MDIIFLFKVPFNFHCFVLDLIAYPIVVVISNSNKIKSTLASFIHSDPIRSYTYQIRLDPIMELCHKYIGYDWMILDLDPNFFSDFLYRYCCHVTKNN